MVDGLIAFDGIPSVLTKYVRPSTKIELCGNRNNSSARASHRARFSLGFYGVFFCFLIATSDSAQSRSETATN